MRGQAARRVARGLQLARDAPRVGDAVEANYKGAGTWYPGTATRVVGDCSGPASAPTVDAWACDVAFDDGDAEERVARSAVRVK